MISEENKLRLRKEMEELTSVSESTHQILMQMLQTVDTTDDVEAMLDAIHTVNRVYTAAASHLKSKYGTVLPT